VLDHSLGIIHGLHVREKRERRREGEILKREKVKKC
jgi:hypothetical protein